MNGKQELALPTCIRVLQKLSLPEEIRNRFIASVAEDKLSRASSLLASAIGSSKPTEGPAAGDRLIAELARREAIFPGSVLALSSDFCSVLDREGTSLFVNEALASVSGKPACNLIGKTCEEWGFPEDVSRKIRDEISLAIDSGAERRCEVTLRIDGQTRHFDQSVIPIASAAGTIRAGLCTLRDSSERRKVEEMGDFIWKSSKTLASSLDFETTLTHVANLAVPTEADWCVLHLVVADTPALRITFARADGAPDGEMTDGELDKALQIKRSDRDGPGAVIRSGNPEHHETLDHCTDGFAATCEKLGIVSTMVVPLVANGKTLGSLLFGACVPSRKYGTREFELAKKVAELAALAVENSRVSTEWKQQALAKKR
jgi:PAS domain S-box-containing protein